MTGPRSDRWRSNAWRWRSAWLVWWVAMVFVPAATIAGDIPSPASILGFEPCAPRQLATYEEIATYLRALDQASERMELVEIGATAEGRTQLMAIISSEENLRGLERYREIASRLARAQDIDDAQARALADEGRAVVWIDFGLHSTERAHAQTAPEMAYRAVTDESDEMRAIRDQVIFLLLPNMNPDGTTLVADWYRRQLDTPWEDSPPPVLYQKYVGHDNNRDWFMFNQPETRNVGRQLYHRWFPQLVYNQHQEAPFPARIFIPPFEDPMNPNIPPLVMRGINLVGEAMSRRLDQEGKPGAVSRVSFDTWWNGGMRTAPYFHNMVGILTETGHSSPSTIVYDPEKFPKTFSTGASTSEPSTFYPRPFRGGEWRFRDSCEYMLSASMAVLDIGAKRRREWLYDIYQMGRDARAAGAGETWVISAAQWDPGTAAKLVNVLRWGGVEVERTLAPVFVGETSYPAGSYLVRGGQAFRPYVRDLLEPQTYPDRRIYPGGPPELPYDITGWTLPLQMGVAVERYDQAIEVETATVEWARPEPAPIRGRGAWGWAIDPRANDGFVLVNRLLAAGASVSRLPEPLKREDADWPAGAFLVESSSTSRALVERAAAELGLPAVALSEMPQGSRRLSRPRIGLYQGWGGNIDEGWTRWLLEQFEFPQLPILDADMREGDLRARFDVIVLPDAGWRSMLTGMAEGTMPPEYTGGMTLAGVWHLHQFVREGGVLVALDSASELPLTAFGLPVRDVTDGLSNERLFIPGTLLDLVVDPGHPLGFGMPAQAVGFFAHSPAFRVGRPSGRLEEQRGIEPAPPADIEIVASWPESGLLRSGWMLGEKVIAGRAAVVEARFGAGTVVLLGLRAQHRGQPHGTFKLFFNALLPISE